MITISFTQLEVCVACVIVGAVGGAVLVSVALLVAEALVLP